MEMYIAREPNGLLIISEIEPKWVGYWYVPCDAMIDLQNREAFPEVTFENSPQKVKIIL